jgi:hypothetical protein
LTGAIEETQSSHAPCPRGEYVAFSA